MKDYLALTKPRITWLILMSTAIGCFFGLRGALDWRLLFHTLLGTALLASGTGTFRWDTMSPGGRTTLPSPASFPGWGQRERIGRGFG